MTSNIWPNACSMLSKRNTSVFQAFRHAGCEHQGLSSDPKCSVEIVVVMCRRRAEPRKKRPAQDEVDSSHIICSGSASLPLYPPTAASNALLYTARKAIRESLFLDVTT